MSVTTTIPCSISPEATAHVAAWGVEAGFEQMLEHALASIPALLRVEVNWEPPVEGDDESRVVITAFVPVLQSGPNPAMAEWRQWVVQNVSPDVWRHVVLIFLCEAVNEG